MKFFLVLSFATTLVAQQTQTVFLGGNPVRGMLSPQMEFGAPVTGKPYTAEAITETTQTLADGNRIVQRSSGMRYRDSQGRERRELSTNTAAGTVRQVVFISDPTAAVIWTLNPLNKAAQKEAMIAAKPEVPLPAHSAAIGVMLLENDHGTVRSRGFDHGALVGGTAAGSAAEQAGLQNEDIILAIDGKPVKDTDDLRARVAVAPVGVPLALDIDRAGTAVRVHLTTGERARVFKSMEAWMSSLPAGPQFEALMTSGLLPPSPDQSRIEGLGTQTFDGVKALGARVTTTIPAGQLGNERPIEVVNEAWYSSELQTTVMTKRSDPRTGEIVFRLANVNRNEPDHSLFEVPADYKIVQQPTPTFVPQKKE